MKQYRGQNGLQRMCNNICWDNEKDGHNGNTSKQEQFNISTDRRKKQVKTKMIKCPMFT